MYPTAGHFLHVVICAQSLEEQQLTLFSKFLLMSSGLAIGSCSRYSIVTVVDFCFFLVSYQAFILKYLILLFVQVSQQTTVHHHSLTLQRTPINASATCVLGLTGHCCSQGLGPLLFSHVLILTFVFISC